MQTPFDLRHEAGLLTASFGDVRILSVPYAEVPAEVYFEGEASFQSLGIAPLIPLPPLPPALPTVLDTEKPAELNWLGDPTYLDKQDDGSVVLRAAKPEGRFTIATPLPQQGICEIVVQLDGVMPGTGVFLGDDKGQPRHIASFMREEASGRIILLETINGENALSHRFVPRAGRRRSSATRSGCASCSPAERSRPGSVRMAPPGPGPSSRRQVGRGSPVRRWASSARAPSRGRRSVCAASWCAS